jgi:cytochrome P450
LPDTGELSRSAHADERVFEFCRSPQRFLLDLALAQNPIATFRVNGESFASLSSPDLIHAVLTGSMEDFEKGPLYDFVGTTFGESVFNADGGAWKDRQADIAPLFSRQRIGQLAGTIGDLIQRQIESWEELANGDGIDMLAATKRLAFDVVRTGLLGISNPVLSDELFDALDRIESIETVRLHYLAKRIPGIRGPFERSSLFERLDQVIYAIVDEKLASCDCPDDLIGASRHGPTFSALAPEGQRKFLRDLIASMLMAGSVSTGESMFWALYLLARHPEVQARAQAELRTGATGAATGNSADRLSNAPIPYLSAILNESLRLYPSGWYMGRTARKSMRLGDSDIPAGTRVICSPFVLHRMPALWPKPEEFRPERFLPGADFPRRAFIPFSVGMRACIGRTLATIEMTALLEAILFRFDVHIVSPDAVSIAAGFSMQPRERVLFRLLRR